MISFFRNRGLIGKITFSITCILIIPTAVVCGFYYHLYRQSLLKEADDGLYSSLRRMTNEMDSNLDLISSVMSAIDYSQELSYFLDDRSKLSDRERAYFRKSIQDQWINIRYTYPNMFYMMRIYSSNQSHQAEYDWKFSIQTMKEFEGYGELDRVTGEIGYGRPREGGQSNALDPEKKIQVHPEGNYILPAYFYVRSLNSKKIVGVVELDMLLDKLLDKQSLEAGSQNCQYMLLDGDGSLLFQTGQYTPEELNRLDFPENEEGQVRTAVLNNKLCRLVSDTCSRTGHRRIALVAQSTVTQSVKDMIWKVGLVAILGITGIMVLTYILLKKLLNRLIIMDEVMGRVGTGDFNVVIEDDGYNDEVSRIKRRFNQMTEKLQCVIQDMIDKEQAQKDAELRALQAQINPHFLYNTLETMRMQCEIDRYYKIGDALSALGDIFHYTIKWENNLVPFSMEWGNLKNYIAIMKLRLDDDFSCEMECDDSAREVMVPKMLLQPVTENSFQHGFKGIVPPWKLWVKAEKAGKALRIIIRDNGSGIPRERLAQIQECIRECKPLLDSDQKYQSIGIINVVQRIRMVCPKGSGLWIENLPDGGVRIEIRIMTEEED